MKLQTRVGLLFDRILDCLIWVACGLLIFVMSSVSVDVVMRYFVHRPLIWVIEVAGYMLLGITFLGAAYVLREEGHTRLELILNQFSPSAQALLNAVTSMVGIAVCMVLTWYSGQVTWQHYQMGYYLDTALDPPSFYFHGIVSVGFLLLVIQFCRRSSRFLQDWSVLRRKGEGP